MKIARVVCQRSDGSYWPVSPKVTLEQATVGYLVFSERFPKHRFAVVFDLNEIEAGMPAKAHAAAERVQP